MSSILKGLFESNLGVDEDKKRYIQAAKDVLKGADFDHLCRVRKLDPETLRKHVDYAWDKVNSGEYKLNRPNLDEVKRDDLIGGIYDPDDFDDMVLRLKSKAKRQRLEKIADTLMNKLVAGYPDVIRNYGHEIVGDAVLDIAEKFSDKIQLEPNDMNVMIRQVMGSLDRNLRNFDEGKVIPVNFNNRQQQAMALKAQQEREWQEYQKLDLAHEANLKRLAAWWWNNDESPAIEKKLERMGLEIGRDEGYDDGGAFIVASGDTNGDTYLSWPAEELENLREGVGKDLAKLGGMSALAIGAGLAGHYADQQHPKVEVGGQQAFLIKNPGWGRVPDTAMILKGKDGKTYKVWSPSRNNRTLYATPVDDVKEGVAEAGYQSPHAKLAQLKAKYDQLLKSGKFNPDTLRKLRDQIIKLEFDLGLKEGVTGEQLEENLRKWFKEKWVRFGPDGKIRGACARGSDSEGKPKCLPQSKAHALGKKGRKYAAAKKRREDPNPERRGPAKNVATKKKSNEGVYEAYDSSLSPKLISAATQAAKIIFLHKAFYGMPDFRQELTTSYNFNPKDYARSSDYVSLYDSIQLVKYIQSKGGNLSYDKNSPIEFELEIPGSQPYNFNIIDIIKDTNESVQGVAEGVNVDSQIKRIKDRILQLKDWNTAGSHDKKIKELQAKLKELQSQKQGVAEGSGDKELYGLRIGDTVLADIKGQKVQGDIIDIFPEQMQVELLLRGGNAGKTVTVDVRDTQSLSEEQLDEKCWSGYKQVGGKMKGGEMVPNCVPKESVEEAEQCPECGGPMFSEMIMNEKKDACYYKVKSRYKVWPSAYASGALVKCRKKGAKNWGTGGKKNESIEESMRMQDYLDKAEELHQRMMDASRKNDVETFERLKKEREELDRLGRQGMTHEGQIYSGGNKPAGMRWYKPRSAPNQNELSKKESAIMKGLQLEGNDEEHHTGGGLGMPYPSTYEQETLPYRTKGQRRTQAIAFESDSGDAHTAMQIAKELNQDIMDLTEIFKSKSVISAGHEHNVKSLKDSIISLSKDLEELGYEYDPDSPGMIHKISGKVFEKWSEKYKRSIDCSNPKGFSQRAHCQGRKKK